jgi:hypothetical protein
MRSRLYSNQKKVFGHKIDLRFVINSPDADDIDVGAIEAANELPSKKKKRYDAANFSSKQRTLLI